MTMSEAQVLKWKALIYLVSTALALVLTITIPIEPARLLLAGATVYDGGMASYYIIVKGARW